MKNNSIRLSKGLLISLFIVIPILFFFKKLFFPELSIIITPDFGLSDIIHGYYPFKFLLSESLKNNQLPYWSSLINGGYPILADGQVGALSVINIVLFKFFPFFLAINLGFIFDFFLGGIGTYLYCRVLKIGQWPSLLAGIIFALSGFNIGQITHISLLQAASFMPLEFYFAEKILKKRKRSDVLLLALIISQQVFSGHQQMTVYSLISLAIYIVVRHIVMEPAFKNSLVVLTAVLLGIIMSSALLVPSIELLMVSARGSSINILSQFPYPISNLIAFINPFYFGNPAKGTYPVFGSNWGIFWENNGYVGLIPIICLILSLIFIKKKEIKLWFMVLVFSILMILGRSSPLYFLYNFPPLSLFRVPSRFLLLTDFSLAIISALMVNYFLTVIKRKIKRALLVSIIIVLQVLNIFYYFYNYHPVETTKKFLTFPDTIQYLNSQKDKGRLFTIDDTEAWNAIFLKSGWQNISQYDQFKSGIIGNSNLFYQLPKAGNMVQFPTKRISIFNNLLSYEVVDKDKGTYRLATGSAKLLGADNISFIITSKIIKLTDIPLQKELAHNYIYRNPFATPRFRIVYDIKQVDTVIDLIDYVNSEAYDPKKTAIVEEKIFKGSTSSDIEINNKIDVLTNKDSDLVFRVSTSQPGIFILADTYYPGWKAYIDDKETRIYPVNIIQKGIMIDKGDHVVKFSYDSILVKMSAAASMISYIAVLFLLINQFIKRLIRKLFN